MIKRHTARALLAAEAGEHERGLADLLWTTGRMDQAATHARRALALDEAKLNRAPAKITRQRFARLLGPGDRILACRRR